MLALMFLEIFCKYACSCTEIIFVLFSFSKILNLSFLALVNTKSKDQKDKNKSQQLRLT
jgi:hypothetical protein